MLNVQFEQGNSSPRIVRITTDSTLAQVTTAGWYPNTAPNQLVPSDQVEIAFAQGTGNAATSMFDVAITAGVVTLSLGESNVILPVVSGDFAVFSGTSGAIADSSYSPTNAAKTKVVMAGSAVTSGYMAKFVDTAGTIDDTAGAVINAGTIQSGVSGTVGGFIAYPATAANGTLKLTPVNAGGAFDTTISNGTMGQSTVMTIPDVGAATGQFLAKTAALVSGNLIKASGTAGVVVDAGFALKANTTAAYAGGGTSNAFVATGLSATSIVTAVILASTNAVSIAKAVPSADTLTVTFSADPGAATTVSWIAITPAV
jgi:hypothetical protein